MGKRQQGDFLLIEIAIIVGSAALWQWTMYASVIQIGVLVWLYYKRRPIVYYVGLSLILTIYFTYEAPLQQVPPQQLTISHHYKIDGDRLKGFMWDENHAKWYVSYQFQSEDEKNQFTSQSLAGKQFIVTGTIQEIPPAAHQYSFSMPNYLWQNKASGFFEVTTWQYVKQHSSWQVWLAQRRFAIQQHIEAVFPQRLQAEAKALLIGMRDGVDDTMTRAYQVLGITHLFAISGLHVGLLSYLFYMVLIRLGVRREWASVLLLIILPCYAILAGGAPSVWRAVMVSCLVILSALMKRRLRVENALALTFICFVMVFPRSIFQIGFQLSYLATFSILYSQKILRHVRFPAISITIVTQMMVSPLLIHHFYEVSLSSFFTNILFVPLFAWVVLPINLLLLFTSYFSLHTWLLWLYAPFRDLLTTIILWLKDVPFQLWQPGQLPIWQSLLLLITIMLSFIALETKRPRLYFPFIITILIIQLSPYWDSRLKISYIDVGQGDSTLIELPYRQGVYVIDSGGVLRFGNEAWRERKQPFEVGRQIVVPLLKGKGITKIDTLILTHPDADHVEGAEEIMQEVKVKEVHVTGGTAKPVMADVVAEVKKQQIPFYVKRRGDVLRTGDYSLYYVSPTIANEGKNNDSLVVYLHSQQFTALFTGDLEAECEESLLQDAQLQNLTILKAGHHGSKTSSTAAFIAHTNPKLTIFSAGRNNRYGHPHPEVLARFEGHHILNTAQQGTIEVHVTRQGNIILQ